MQMNVWAFIGVEPNIQKKEAKIISRGKEKNFIATSIVGTEPGNTIEKHSGNKINETFFWAHPYKDLKAIISCGLGTNKQENMNVYLQLRQSIK